MKRVSSFQFPVSGLTAKGCFLLVIYCLLSIACYSQDTTSIALNKNFTVTQDAKISELLYKYKDYNRKREFAEGYRIQIMYTDVRDEVYKSKGAMYKEFSELASYVEYEAPYYKLRLGDFKSRLEATYFLQEIIPLYPGAFIVRDKIKLR
jgi:hypothetical protein